MARAGSERERGDDEGDGGVADRGSGRPVQQDAGRRLRRLRSLGGPHGPGMDAADWRRHRFARLGVVLVVPPLLLLAPEHHRPWPMVAAFLVYFLVAAFLAARAEPPTALSAPWWATVVADCVILLGVVVDIPVAEPVVLLGFLLVVVVNGAAFGVRAAVAAAGTSIVAVVAAHALEGEAHLTNVLVDILGFVMMMSLVTYVVARQAEDLRSHRLRLEKAMVDLRRVDELRSRLVSTLAHDIRSPLSTIQGATQTLVRHHDELASDVQIELLEGVEHQTERLLRLANGLLDLARLEEGRLELDIRQTPLREVVESALSYADPDGRIEVRVEPDVLVAVDVERAEQIFVNLANNTLRHGASPFVVHAACADGRADVTFSDAGPGVPPDKVGSLFEPFRRGDTVGSVGFGLWIVRMLTEAHGGTVSYEPNTPTGACFHVVFPVASPDGRVSRGRASADPVEEGATIRGGGSGES